MRKNKDLHHIIITPTQDQVAVRIEGLNAGADENLVKSFDLDELSVRLAAVSHRFAAAADPEIQVGPVSVGLGRWIVTVLERKVA